MFVQFLFTCSVHPSCKCVNDFTAHFVKTFNLKNIPLHLHAQCLQASNCECNASSLSYPQQCFCLLFCPPLFTFYFWVNFFSLMHGAYAPSMVMRRNTTLTVFDYCHLVIRIIIKVTCLRLLILLHYWVNRLVGRLVAALFHAHSSCFNHITCMY